MNPQIYQIKLTDPLKIILTKKKKHKIHMKISTKVGMVSNCIQRKKVWKQTVICK